MTLPDVAHAALPQDFDQFRVDQLPYRAERAELINPEIEDPDIYFDFNARGMLHPKGTGVRAKVTIDLFGLNRGGLRTRRRAVFDRLELDLKLRAAQILRLRERGKIKRKRQYNQALSLVFDKTFSELDAMGRVEESYTAWRRWIKTHWLEHLAVNDTTRDVINDAWNQYKERQTP